MKSRIAAVAAAVALGITCTPAGAHAASTATTAGSGGGWLPTSEPDRVIPTGRACPFDMTAVVQSQDEQYRVAATYPDGSPLEYEFRGPLIIKYTNTDNGKSVIRDLSGTAQLFLPKNGEALYVSEGNAALIIHPLDPYLPTGLYILTGPSVFVIHPDTTADPDSGNNLQILAAAHREDLCRTLA